MRKRKEAKKIQNLFNTRLDSEENENTINASSLLLESTHTYLTSKDSEYKMCAFNKGPNFYSARTKPSNPTIVKIIILEIRNV